MMVVSILLLVGFLWSLNWRISNYVQFQSNQLKNNKLMNGFDSDFLFLEYNSYYTFFTKK